MADKTVITAAVRTEFGKGAARRTRREGRIPVVLYGHGTEPQHLSLPAHDTFLALRGNANALLTLDIEGSEQLALTKDVQVDPVKRSIEHVDLLIVRKGEKVTVDIAVHTEGETFPGTIHTVESQTLTVTADATAIPESVVVDIEGLEDGHTVRVEDLPAIPGATFEDDPETPVVVVTVPRVDESDLETPAAEGDEETEGEQTEGGSDESAEGESSSDGED
ncbi:50S ribosomal protein L25/general stress protein Ctc [Georgenia sp. Z1491]|uniref:50S ribosomal protein L25/general stress protein Ctc n=1 Tax=Georgenia sp. Z1491 TaxID=3416707 RepID=UPI003CE9C48C